ncbi:transcriptional regulator [Streptomyces benahoarensis]|uniref:Transcriptional regulator n=1 Tax=Streptomyces benahoarensis TaxID=2595054 RepID=A0A553ZPK9_9ACTN|nr:transcriptional regulator [Streptomyces benahoarensis]TSB28279.1 transcriptional regulator [Streptomyces benahoarensis]TSB43325.1 transcriptional regulator [Streptomyces benahoarensis]
MSVTAATFAAVFAVLYVGHSVGDHWVQTSPQSADKGKPGWGGRLADTRHVATLTATKLVLLLPVALLLGLHLSAAGLVAGLGVDAVTHWWADRRSTLAKLAKLLGQEGFYTLGTAAHPAAPVTAKGTPAAHLGTGAYALDQAWHHLWLLVAALLIATV